MSVSFGSRSKLEGVGGTMSEGSGEARMSGWIPSILTDRVYVTPSFFPSSSLPLTEASDGAGGASSEPMISE